MFEILENAVRLLVKYFNEDYDAQLGFNFEADSYDEIVFFTIIDEIEAEESFLLNLYEQFPYASNLNPFLWALLHEIGHLQTDEDADDDADLRKALMLPDKNHTTEQRREMYYRLPSESCATDWAAYASYAHRAFLSEWWNNVWMPAFSKFVIDNEIER